MAAEQSETHRWTLLEARDARHRQAFVYAVVTTGIYCRPGCASRLPNRDNVRFFDDGLQARQAGFRPCKRCCPDALDGDARRRQLMVALCRYIEDAEHSPTLAELAQRAGLSAGHLQRLFKATVGISPKAYSQWLRRQRLGRHLSADAPVTEAALAAGLTSPARLAEWNLGAAPRQLCRRGVDMTIEYALGRCRLGGFIVGVTGRGICVLELGDEEEALVAGLARRFPRAALRPAPESFAEMLAAVAAFLDRTAPDLPLPLDIQGTVFQQRVWAALRRIPAGQTRSYAQLAVELGNPRAVRAVAGACAANPIAVAIPCHRVVRSDGSLSGYRWGTERKRALLDIESGEATS